MNIIESIKNESTIGLNKILETRNNYINNKNIIPMKKQIQQYEKYRKKINLLKDLLVNMKIFNPIITNGDIINTKECCLNFDIIKKYNIIEYDKDIIIIGLLNFSNSNSCIQNMQLHKSNIFNNISSIRNNNYLIPIEQNQADKIISAHIIASGVLQIKNKLNDYLKTHEYYKELGLYEILIDYDNLRTNYNDTSIIAIFCKLIEIKNIILEETETILKNTFMLDFNIEEIKQKTITEIDILISCKIKVIDLIIQGLYVDLYELN